MQSCTSEGKPHRAIQAGMTSTKKLKTQLELGEVSKIPLQQPRLPTHWALWAELQLTRWQKLSFPSEWDTHPVWYLPVQRRLTSWRESVVRRLQHIIQDQKLCEKSKQKPIQFFTTFRSAATGKKVNQTLCKRKRQQRKLQLSHLFSLLNILNPFFFLCTTSCNLLFFLLDIQNSTGTRPLVTLSVSEAITSGAGGCQTRWPPAVSAYIFSDSAIYSRTACMV